MPSRPGKSKRVHEPPEAHLRLVLLFEVGEQTCPRGRQQMQGIHQVHDRPHRVEIVRKVNRRLELGASLSLRSATGGALTASGADRWLREAVRLRRGTAGLEELARQDSPWGPQAWLDWVEAIAGQQEPARLLRAAKEASENIPEGLESRARAADHL